jgi:ATP-binding cassette subfamily C protein CydC
VLLLTGGLAVTAGRMEGPVLVMLLLFAAASFEAAGLMPAALQHLPGTREAVRRIRELADMPPALPEPATPAVPAGTAIIFRDVTCRYGDGVTALERFNLSIGAGERVALAGPSGIGKSTVAELLLRFRPYAGSVTIGGAEVRDLAPADLPAVIAALPQAPHLFNTTLRENILLGRPDADGAVLDAAVADAGLKDWIARLPGGLDTPVGEMGRAVSGGEGRRIALARALLADAPILVLDEPTEGLDAATEREVVARLERRLAGKTVLVITHRPACLALADRVVRLG